MWLIVLRVLRLSMASSSILPSTVKVSLSFLNAGRAFHASMPSRVCNGLDIRKDKPRE